MEAVVFLLSCLLVFQAGQETVSAQESCEGLDNINNAPALTCTRDSACLSLNCNMSGLFSGFQVLILLHPCNEPPAVRIVASNQGVEVLNNTFSTSMTQGVTLAPGTNLEITVQWEGRTATISAQVTMPGSTLPILPPTTVTLPPCSGDSPTTQCPTTPSVTCPTCPTCETPTERPTPSSPPPITPPGAVSTDNISVLGCGIVSWKPPADTGGEMPGYAIRFFDGDTYETSTYTEIQRYFDDPDRRWAVATNLSSTRPIYADIGARNSAGVGPFSGRKIVADTTVCPEPACDSCCTTPPVSLPGTVTNVRVINCNTLEWNRPADDGGEIIEYRIRVFSGANYFETNESRVFRATTTRLVMNWLPSTTPITAIVKAKNSAGFSAAWSQAVTLTEGASSCSALG